MTVATSAHKHQWLSIRAIPLRKQVLGPTQRWLERYGIWETRICVHCLEEDARWMPGITEASRLEASDAMRPKSEEDLRKRLVRETRLGAILMETRARQVNRPVLYTAVGR